MCGFWNSTLVMVPISVTGLLESNSAANEWCATTGAAAQDSTQPATSTPSTLCFIVFLRCGDSNREPRARTENPENPENPEARTTVHRSAQANPRLRPRVRLGDKCALGLVAQLVRVCRLAIENAFHPARVERSVPLGDDDGRDAVANQVRQRPRLRHEAIDADDEGQTGHRDGRDRGEGRRQRDEPSADDGRRAL